MGPGLIIRLGACGAWRIGPNSGARDRVDLVYHSDTLYSAVSSAMVRLGMLDDWIAATFQNPQGPAVRFSSCFPYQDETLFIIPPMSLWPPSVSPKVRWKGARFVPLSIVTALLAEQPLNEDRWAVDGLSQCLVPSDAGRGPFRVSVRSNAAVDRLSQNIEIHETACLEFSQGAGLWALAAFANEEARTRWTDPVRAAFRLLSDTGFGGRRSRGWGRSEMPEFLEGVLPDLILPPSRSAGTPEADAEPARSCETVFWLLSLFTPAAEDSVNWDRGSYSLLTRGGRVESPVAWGAPKKLSRMVAEGSVISAEAPVCGAAHDVAPDGFPHPVYRAGFALAIPIPWRVSA